NLLDDAEKVIAKVLSLDPGNAGAMQLQTTLRAGRVQHLLRQAESLSSAGNLQHALALIDRNIAEFPDEQRLLALKKLFAEVKRNAGMGTVYGPALNPIHFSIYYPSTICPGKWHVVLAYVHLYSAVQAVRADCESRMRHEKDQPHQAK